MLWKQILRWLNSHCSFLKLSCLLVPRQCLTQVRGIQSRNKTEQRFCNREEPNLTTRWICFLYFNLCFHCFCSLKDTVYTQWPASGNPAPSAWMLNQSAFVQGSILTLCTCGWLQERRNEHIPSPRLAIPGHICKSYGLFTLLPHRLPAALFYKRNWHPNSDKMVFLETLVCHLFGLPAFRIKSYPLPQHLVTWFIDLLCGEQSKLGLGNNLSKKPKPRAPKRRLPSCWEFRRRLS